MERVFKLGWAGNIARTEDKTAFKTLTGKPTGKLSLGTPRRSLEDSIRMDFVGLGGLG